MIGPSLLGIFILGFTQDLTVAKALEASMGNTIVVFMLVMSTQPFVALSLLCLILFYQRLTIY